MRGKSWRSFKRQSRGDRLLKWVCCVLLVLEVWTFWYRTGQPFYSVEEQLESHWQKVTETITPGLDWILKIRLRIRDGTLEIYRIHYSVSDSPISKNYE
ncbi:hypothetical protein DW974_00910 [Lachnospiraceae bacterium AM48-27BH]|nr:hypothetical protein DW974_00910 [Lachnospiraceae bacterium AM48-27BH]